MQRIQCRQTTLFYKTGVDYGTQVAKALTLDLAKAKKLAAMTREERAKATEK